MKNVGLQALALGACSDADRRPPALLQEFDQLASGGDPGWALPQSRMCPNVSAVLLACWTLAVGQLLDPLAMVAAAAAAAVAAAVHVGLRQAGHAAGTAAAAAVAAAAACLVEWLVVQE